MTDVVSREHKVSARERSSWLLRNIRILLLALVLLVIAGILLSVTFAAFTSTSANAANIFTAGSLSHSNSAANQAILSADNMIPGDVVQGTVTISNTGESAGAFRLESSAPSDTPGPYGGNLSTILQLQVIQDPGTADTQIYSGGLDDLTTPIDLGTWAGGTQHMFKFVVTFPEGGTPSGPTTGDNAFQGSSTTVTYTWTAIST
jgi:spore coat-associated protein N